MGRSALDRTMSPEKQQSSSRPRRERWVALVLRIMPTERQRLLALTILSGGLCGLAAVAFHVGIVKASALLIDRAEAAHGHWWIPLTILSPALGGLLAGLGISHWGPGAGGRGGQQVTLAYGRTGARV